MSAKLKLLVDGRCLEGNLTGVGYYILSILEHLVRVRELEVSVVMRGGLKAPIPPGVHIVYECNSLFGKIKPVVWQRFLSHRLFTPYDIYWGTSSFLPVRLRASARSLVTIHDFNHLIVPETMPWGNRLANAAWMLRDIERADYVMANSQGTCQRMRFLIGRKSDIIINPPVRDSLMKLVPGVCLQDRKSMVTGRFFLAVGTYEPRKNLEILVTAFGDLKRAGKLKDHKLLLVGGAGWKNDRLRHLIGMYSSLGVIECGYTDDTFLAYLYSKCDAFIFPSIYEGFGMPVREALAFGAPIIATDLQEIREAANEFGTFIQPTHQNLSEAMLNAALQSPRSMHPVFAAPPPICLDPLIDWMIGGSKLNG